MVHAKAHSIDSRLLLIDNASTDETKEEASKMVSELFAHKRNEDRWGFQKSVNYGVNDAFERGFDIALVCNNDIIIHPEALWRLAERFGKDGVGMVTCMDVRGEVTERGLQPFQVNELNAKEKEIVDEAPFPNFSAFAVNKQCWLNVGEFDELYAPAYFEDNDYHYRMKLANIPAIVYPPAMFYHYGSRTQNESAENGMPMVSGGMFENARAAYVRKWGGVPGSETYTNPYNEPLKNYSITKQSI
jgi:GT2 family glycosyltransferase